MFHLNIFLVSCCFLISRLKADSCPEYSAMANLDATKVSGYSIISNIYIYIVSLLC